MKYTMNMSKMRDSIKFMKLVERHGNQSEEVYKCHFNTMDSANGMFNPTVVPSKKCGDNYSFAKSICFEVFDFKLLKSTLGIKSVRNVGILCEVNTYITGVDVLLGHKDLLQANGCPEKYYEVPTGVIGVTGNYIGKYHNYYRNEMTPVVSAKQFVKEPYIIDNREFFDNFKTNYIVTQTKVSSNAKEGEYTKFLSYTVVCDVGY